MAAVSLKQWLLHSSKLVEDADWYEYANSIA